MSGAPTHPPRVPWRVLRSGPGAPAWNMALDEALLETFADDDAPLLRLYRWRPAALSLGRFQPARELEPPPGAVLVRRITGGAAIHHREDEVTYSVVAPYRAFADASPRAAYAAVHAVIARALVDLGVPLAPRASAGQRSAHPAGWCYSQPTDYDLVVGERKLVGSAQRRRGRVFLQHGSLPRSPDPRAVGSTSLAELVESPPSVEAIEDAIIAALESTLASRLVHDAMRETHRAAAQRIERARYGNPAWSFER